MLPASVQGWLINHIGTVHGDVPEPMGLTLGEQFPETGCRRRLGHRPQ
ncbi:hypothetical protein [Streptomyces lunaelactis]|nr:hypothetical protein [Streptomyces lunaelactis]NUK84075.1 hypothetical protein [Streptomyces lunaelactis]